MPLDLVVVDAALKSVDTVKADQADIGFFAIDPRRSDGIGFTAPYVLIEGAYVAAGVRQQLESDAARLGGLRLLPGRFTVIEQAMGLPLTRGADAMLMLARFVEQVKASGYVAQSLLRHGIRGAIVAPASG